MFAYMRSTSEGDCVRDSNPYVCWYLSGGALGCVRMVVQAS